MSNYAIEIEGLWKQYRLGESQPYLMLRDLLSHPFGGREKSKDEFWALQDINLKVKEGEVLGVIGKNGSGKSTLLKILTRITPPTKGQIKLHGRVASLLEVGTGFSPELTGRENIFLNGSILGMTKKEIKRQFDEIVDFSGVEKFIDTPVKRYSSGMYVRLAFAVAAHLESEILLVDEVLAVGDAEFQKKSLGKMKDVTQTGKTVLFVSHNLGTITSLCDKAVHLQQGTIEASGNSRKVVDGYLNSKTQNSPRSLNNIQDRTGKGFVRLTEVYWTDTLNQRIESLQIGQPVKLHMKYSSQEQKLELPVFGITIKDSVGRPLAMVNSLQSEHKFIALKGKGKVVCSIPKWPIMSGNYYITAGISLHKDLQDELELPQPLQVIPGQFFPDGMLNLNPQFQGFFFDNSWDEE